MTERACQLLTRGSLEGSNPKNFGLSEKLSQDGDGGKGAFSASATNPARQALSLSAGNFGHQLDGDAWRMNER